jgi:predicted nucleic acid-binding protein
LKAQFIEPIMLLRTEKLPGIVDANVLVYAIDADAPQHVVSRALLDVARDSSTTLYVTSQILCEFYSIVTNARRVPIIE